MIERTDSSVDDRWPQRSIGCAIVLTDAIGERGLPADADTDGWNPPASFGGREPSGRARENGVHGLEESTACESVQPGAA